MPTTSTNFSIQDLPGLGDTTPVIDLPSDAKTPFKAEARYISLKSGEHHGTHASAGEVLIFCVAGSLDAKVNAHHHEFKPNQLLHVTAGSPFRIEAKQDSAILITSLTAKPGIRGALEEASRKTLDRNDEVQEALEETFPASDPPSYNSTIL